MALNSPSDLSLGKLGHIAAGNGDSTSETSLNDCGRDSGTGETAMWANFRIGSTSIVFDSGVFDASDRGYFKIRVKNDVGAYMGGTAGGEYVSSALKTGIDGENTYVCHIEESSDGSLYESRIAQNSDNSSDYDATFTLTVGDAEFSISNSPYTDKDKFRFLGGI